MVNQCFRLSSRTAADIDSWWKVGDTAMECSNADLFRLQKCYWCSGLDVNLTMGSRSATNESL
jgi:hypothetical protein